jgi:hypothetical protein
VGGGVVSGLRFFRSRTDPKRSNAKCITEGGETIKSFIPELTGLADANDNVNYRYAFAPLVFERVKAFHHFDQANSLSRRYDVANFYVRRIFRRRGEIKHAVHGRIHRRARNVFLLVRRARVSDPRRQPVTPSRARQIQRQ